MMREEFYQSQYGDPVNNYMVRSTCCEAVKTTSAATAAAINAAAATAAVNATAKVVQDEDEVDVVDVASANPPSESFL